MEFSLTNRNTSGYSSHRESNCVVPRIVAAGRSSNEDRIKKMEHKHIATSGIMPMSMFILAFRMLTVSGGKSLSSACMDVVSTRT